MRFLLVLAVSLCASLPALSFGVGGTDSDSTAAPPVARDVDDPPVFGIMLNPLSLYSAVYGFGLEASASLYHVPVSGSRIRVSVWPSVRRQLAMLEIEAPDPVVSPLFVHGHILLSRNRAYRFYGVGPLSEEGDRTELDRDGLDAELGLGLQARGRRALAIPYVRYAGQEVKVDPVDLSGIPEQVGVTGASVDPARPVPGRGLAFGLKAELDGRDDPLAPRLGVVVQARVERYTSIADQGLSLSYDVFDGLVAGYLPMPFGHVLVGRGIFTTTSNRGDLALPFYHLPVLDWRLMPGYERNRFVGPDRLLLQAEYQAPVFPLGTFAELEAVVLVGVGNVYDDIGEQFRAAVEFGNDVARADGTVALRPSFGVGFKVGSFLHWIVGFSPEDVTPFGPLRFQFTYPFRAAAPALR